MAKRSMTSYYLLLAVCALMALLAIFFLYQTISKNLQIRGQFAAELTYYSAQADYEILQLMDHMDRFTSDDPDVTHRDVVARFDIVWSRSINTTFTTGRGLSYASLPGAMAAIAKLQQTLREIEPVVMALKRDERAVTDQLRARLRGDLADVHAVSLEALASDAWNDEHTVQAQLRRTYISIALVLGLLVTGSWLMIRGQLDRRALAELNQTLEDRVSFRTGQLEAANAALNDEIEERKRSQLKASERETRLLQAAQISKLGYYVRDASDDRCIYCSEQHARSYGLSQLDYVGAAYRIEGQLARIHLDDQERVRAAYQRLRQGEQIELEYRVQTENGERRIREAACPILNFESEVVQEIGSTIDITEQYQTELKLFESQRLDSIGKMTGGMAHDFNNLLSIILGNLEMCRAADPNPDRKELLDDAIGASRRASDLVRKMLSFARKAPLEPTQFSLNETVSGMQELLHRTLPENILVQSVLASDLMPVHADRSSTESALLNLILNARDAMQEGGQIVIETSNVQVSPGDEAHRDGDLAPGEYVLLSVTDNGSGIDSDLMPNIFEPFVSSKDPTANSGLGLSMVHGFMQQTNGTVSVSSDPGRGTKVALYFPAHAASAAISTPRNEAADLPEPGARILLVEDEAEVRKTVRRHLDRAGLSVEEAADGAEAAAKFEANGPFDLLLTDVVMPGALQGTHLAARLRELKPELPVIFLSGYRNEADLPLGGMEINDTYLMKPAPRDKLLGAISKALA